MDRFLKQLKDNWIILLFIGGLIASWTMFSARLAQAENDITELQTFSKDLQQIKIDVAVIREKISSLDDKIPF